MGVPSAAVPGRLRTPYRCERLASRPALVLGRSRSSNRALRRHLADGGLHLPGGQAVGIEVGLHVKKAALNEGIVCDLDRVASALPDRPVPAQLPPSGLLRSRRHRHRTSRAEHCHRRVDTHRDLHVVWPLDRFGRHLATTRARPRRRAIGQCWPGPEVWGEVQAWAWTDWGVTRRAWSAVVARHRGRRRRCKSGSSVWLPHAMSPRMPGWSGSGWFSPQEAG